MRVGPPMRSKALTEASPWVVCFYIPRHHFKFQDSGANNARYVSGMSRLWHDGWTDIDPVYD